MDKDYRRLKYMRYADDFLIGIIGNKEDSRKVKEDFRHFLLDTLKLELSEKKTLITNAQAPAKFLGYDIFVRRSNATKRNKDGVNMRLFGSRIVLNVTNETMKKKLLGYDAMTIKQYGRRHVWKSKARPCMKNNDDLEIIDQYNAEIRGFFNYYAIANNSYSIDSFYNIMEYSMYKTFACKYRTSTRKIIRRFSINKEFAVPYANKKGQILYRKFYNEGFKRKALIKSDSKDLLPKTVAIACNTSLIERLKAKRCEYCGTNESLQMHHVKKLKDLKGKKQWEKHMIARRRKTLAVCKSCQIKIHTGKLD